MKLKPCPFCGGIAEPVKYRSAEDAMTAFILCKSCGSRGPELEDAYAPVHEAGYMWNVRITEAGKAALEGGE